MNERLYEGEKVIKVLGAEPSGVAGRLKASRTKPTVMLSEFQKVGIHGLVGWRGRRSPNSAV